MSVFSPIVTVNDAQAAAQNLVDKSQAFLIATERFLLDSAGSLWSNDASPAADILAALGPRAAKLFTYHAALVQLVADADPAFVAEIAAIIRPTTAHEDGTVTVA